MMVFLMPPKRNVSKFSPFLYCFLLISAVYKGNHIKIALGVIGINPMLPNSFQFCEVGTWGVRNKPPTPIFSLMGKHDSKD